MMMGALYILKCNMARKKLQMVFEKPVLLPPAGKKLQFYAIKKRKKWGEIRKIEMAFVHNAHYTEKQCPFLVQNTEMYAWRGKMYFTEKQA